MFAWFSPGPLELLILVVIFGIPAVAVIVVLLIVQRQSRQREWRGNQPTFPRGDQPAGDSQPVDAEVVEESGKKGQPAEG